MRPVMGCRGGVVVRRVPLDEEFGRQRFAAHVLQAPLVGDVASLAGSGGQIHPQHPSGEAVKAPRVGVPLLVAIIHFVEVFCN